ncbi:hypothetical protein AN3261.2 [Aspergillus nidulans FGSC A4]|uniref:Major facilitator superfamily (MFS) profile domain-containing protein n=1 Tax=Emericella nidulans (strain FGSC A4 / ATCC 38163 / CBS 112.46 / NRRL 194 / M139) TaxID=227321 RepID=Q5B869_EMENI|nr:hypothetical protein [Aspergillus nidulans FGSC A4]EAA63162.1 hypothetical protein AN3261.2 [Aspergillus nidulans FGSC A4]CBF83078.1 TPA: conserved hypothetical protein [Aspergillus nidulans FGSC A4]|eukprot:XP_660865.1 hypothetical protein AN3261.2 [Aspergillus nidulans FGSC A4]
MTAHLFMQLASFSGFTVFELVYTPKFKTKVLVSCNLNLATRIQCMKISDLCIGGYIEEECVVDRLCTIQGGTAESCRNLARTAQWPLHLPTDDSPHPLPTLATRRMVCGVTPGQAMHRGPSKELMRWETAVIYGYYGLKLLSLPVSNPPTIPFKQAEVSDGFIVTTFVSSEKDNSVVGVRGLKGNATETTLVNILVIVASCLGGFTYGFAANTLSGTLSQTTFIAKFLNTPNSTCSRMVFFLGTTASFRILQVSFSWRRLVFIVLTGIGVLHLVSLFFIPESPRWLTEKGREDETKVVLEYLHHEERYPCYFCLCGRAADQSARSERNTPRGYMHIIRTPSYRKRALCSIRLWVMSQRTGITAVANSIPTLMGTLGSGTTMQLGLGVVWTVCAVIGCVQDNRELTHTYHPGVNAAVAFYFIFGAYFTSTIECTAYVYGSEICPTHMRSEGSTIAFASFFGNETMGLSLEEINSKFGDKVELKLKDALDAQGNLKLECQLCQCLAVPSSDSDGHEISNWGNLLSG